jgi:hypothetical protein
MAVSNRQWNTDFARSWQELEARHGTLQLSGQLARAARKFRDEGNKPTTTASGLYWGTKDALRQQAEQAARLSGGKS